MDQKIYIRIQMRFVKQYDLFPFKFIVTQAKNHNIPRNYYIGHNVHILICKKYRSCTLGIYLKSATCLCLWNVVSKKKFSGSPIFPSFDNVRFATGIDGATSE